jgi:DNA repair protein RadC
MKKQFNTIHEMEVVYLPGGATTNEEDKINSSIRAYDILKQVYNPNTISCQEEFIVLYLNQANVPLGTYKAGKGGITGTVADVRLILGTALKALATGLIISHNHPSGTLKPSEADKQLTTKLKEACKLMDIVLLDHLILAPHEGYYSFADEGVL